MRTGKILFLVSMVLLACVYTADAATITVTTTIQAAIDSASNGDVIKIPAGTYNEVIVIDGFDKLTITGAGQSLTVIDGFSQGDDVVTITNSKKITFQDCLVTDADPGFNNLFIRYADNVIITKCAIGYAGGNGIFCEYSARVIVKNCLIQSNLDWGVYLSDTYNSSVTSSTLSGNANGVAINPGHNTIISKNTITNSTSVGILSAGQNSIVQNNFITGSGSVALNHFSPGTFGNVYSKNVISGNLNVGVQVFGGFPTFISNLISDNSGIGFYSDSIAYNTMVKNTVSGNGNFGVYLRNSSGYLSNNRINGNSSTGVFQNTANIPMTTRILTLTGNKITTNGSYGVNFIDGSGYSVMDARKNYIVDNNNDGIFLDSGQGAFLDKNTIGGNNNRGIASNDSLKMSVTKNYLFNNVSHGIFTWGNYNTVIYSNRVYSNIGAGIAGFSIGSHVDRNVVLSNGLNGIDATFGSGSLIENNKVFGNGDGISFFDLHDNQPTDDIWSNNKYGTSLL